MIDLLALIPFDWIACAVVAPHGGDSMLARYLTLLGLLRLLRLYRVGVLLSYLGVNLSVSLAIVTITRNFMARLRGRRSGGPGRGCEVVRRPTNAASQPPPPPPGRPCRRPGPRFGIFVALASLLRRDYSACRLV